MIDWLLTWWPIVLIYLSKGVIVSFVGLFYQWLDRHLDEIVPDDRAQSTEDWVDGKLDELGLIAEVDLGRWGPLALRKTNAFIPWTSSIALADQTADKKDATFWIIGAHELGHAIWHRRFPRISRWAIGARSAASMPWAFALTLMLVNTLWGWSLVSDMILFLLVTHVVLMAVVLVDEALASRTALELVADEQFTPLEHRSIRQKLVAAFGTYVSTTVVAVVMLIFWGPLRSTLEAGQQWRQPTDPNHEWWVGVTVAFLAIGVGAVGGLWLRGKWLDRETDEDEEDEEKEEPELNCRLIVVAVLLTLALAGAATAFWFLTYDRPYGDPFRVALIFAAPICWLLPGLALGFLGLPVNLLVGRIKKALDLDETPEDSDPTHRHSLDELEQQNRDLGELLDKIDLSKEGQKKLEREERSRRKKKRDPDKPWERRPPRKRRRGRFDLEDLPDRGTLRFWLFQLNPIWLLPAIGLWLAW